MPDLLDRILHEVRQRLDASRSAAEEYRQLERALEAIDGTSPKPDDRGRARRSNRRSGRPRESKRAQRERNRERLLAVLRDRPGVTREELSNVSGVSAAVLAQQLRRLVENEQVTERALPGGQRGYALAANATTDQPAH